MKTHQIQPGGVVYVYQAAFLCEACGERMRFKLDSEGLTPEESENETTYDSDDYPKGPYRAEEVETCDSMDRCLNLTESEVTP